MDKKSYLIILLSILLLGSLYYLSNPQKNPDNQSSVCDINYQGELAEPCSIDSFVNNSNYSVAEENNSLQNTTEDPIEPIEPILDIPENNSKNYSQNLSSWAEKNNIKLVATYKTSDDLYYNGFSQEDSIDLETISNLDEAYLGLSKIPEDLLKAMDGKTIYLSSGEGRGYTVLGSWPEQNILSGVDRGFVLEQPITQLQAIHEFAHILDYHGIRGIYGDPNNYWSDLESLRADIFSVDIIYDPYLLNPPEGYIDIYSTSNDAENFAQHFALYILKGEEFRNLSKSNTFVKEKYDFFRNYLFDGKEY